MIEINDDFSHESSNVDRRTLVNNDHAIRIALLEQAMKNITTELHGINDNISKLIWVVIAAIAASAVQFMLRGGLA